MTVVFVALRLIPGDVVTLLVQDQNVTPETAAQLRHDLGLDAPLPVQFARYLSDLAQGNPGRSIWSGRSIAPELGSRLPVTAELTLFAALFGGVLGVGGGMIAAVRQSRWPDYLLRGVSIAGLSL